MGYPWLRDENDSIEESKTDKVKETSGDTTFDIINRNLNSLSREQLEQLRNSINELCPLINNKVEDVNQFDTIYINNMYYELQNTDFEFLNKSYIMKLSYNDEDLISKVDNSRTVFSPELNTTYYIDEDESYFKVVYSEEKTTEDDDYDHVIMVFLISKEK